MERGAEIIRDATLLRMGSDYCHVSETEQGLGIINVTSSEGCWTKTYINFAAAANAAMTLKLIPAGLALIATHRIDGYARSIRTHIPQGLDGTDLTAYGFKTEQS